MESGVLALGAELIVWLQQPDLPAVKRFFEILTNFGGSYYLYMFPLLLWAVDHRVGVRVLAVFALTLFVNTTLKEWIGHPRPFDFDPRVVSDGEAGFGLPSGHAQLVVVFWGILASRVGRPWFWVLAVLIMFWMGFSRIYLGVHFPTDVLGGWLLGGVTLWIVLRYGPQIDAWLDSLDVRGRAGWALAAGVFMLLFDALFVNDHNHLNPGVAGLVVGAGVGAAIAGPSLRFEGHGPGWQRGLRFVLGTVGMLALLGAFRRLGAPDGMAGALVIALDLALLGLWLTWVAPWLFQRLRLAPRAEAGSTRSVDPPALPTGPRRLS